VSEFTWYTRLATWAGALVLLVQSVTGRSTGIMTLIGVVLLAGGFAAFLSGLALDGRAARTRQPFQDDALLPEAGPTNPPSPSGIEQPRVRNAQEPAVSIAQPVTFSAPQSSNVGEQAVSISAEEVRAGSSLRGATCPRCSREIVEGQMAARCPICEMSHHGACWIDNRFHCSTPGCPGHGNLVAPGEASSAERT
jgi:hypothetical protein